jgi:4-hydroxy-3-polyprenylbenzoate decarboxylase
MNINNLNFKGPTWDDLSDFLDKLEELGELKKISAEVDPKHEVGAICRKLNMIKGPAVLFTNVKGSRIPVVGQLLAIIAD